MRKVSSRLFFWILLIVLACVKFQYHGRTFDLEYPGLVVGFLVMIVMGVVLLFRAFNALQDLFIARGRLTSRVVCKYDILLPLAIIAVALKGAWHAGTVTDAAGVEMPRFFFGWSDATWDVPFVAALVGLLFLVRVILLLRALAAHGAGNPAA